MDQVKLQPANIKVFCRFRPLNNIEIEHGVTQNIHHKISDKCLLIKGRTKDDDLTFVFDKIFDTDTSQEEIYNEVGAPILSNILDGFNGTIIAYGQTSSGKTHTIQGCSSDPKNKGIIPRIVENLFVAIENSNQCIEFKLKVSILELYMEKLYDLIDTSKTDLKIRESKLEGNYVEHKTQVYISDRFELQRLINIAQKNRVTCVTNMNANSSRSHLIFQLTLSQFNSQTSQAKVSNLFIVDLAGSQKVSKTGAQGKTLEQAKKINLSLTCLAKVIKSLSQKIPHVPYRDSKLTRIIQDSLGGNSKTSLILTCSPHETNISQTISTLRFGETAQKIKNKPKINRQPTIQQLQNIIQKLQNRIKAKDKWIATLQLHLKTLGAGLPRIRVSAPSPKSPQKLCSTTDLGYLNLKDSIPSSNFLTVSIANQFHQFESQSSIGGDEVDKYLGQSCTLQIPSLIYSEFEHSKCDTQRDEQIMNLQNQLATVKASLQAETNKFYDLKKQYNSLNDNIKEVIQQNIEYQKKQEDLQTTIKKLKAIIEDNQSSESEFMIFKNIKQNEQNLSANEEQDKENEINSQILKLRQENKELLSASNNLKIENQLLQLKVKSKQSKISQLKHMMQQIQQQMELMEEEYDEPLTLNTRIANPIKRSVIFQ